MPYTEVVSVSWYRAYSMFQVSGRVKSTVDVRRGSCSTQV